MTLAITLLFVAVAGLLLVIAILDSGLHTARKRAREAEARAEVFAQRVVREYTLRKQADERASAAFRELEHRPIGNVFFSRHVPGGRA